MLSQPVTKEFILSTLEKLPQDSLIEVAQFIESLQFQGRKPLQQGNPGEHKAFGIWADYPEAGEPGDFALKLRKR